MPRRDGCGFCDPVPGREPLFEPDPTCPRCWAASYSMFPGTDLDADTWRVIGGLLDLRAGGACEACGKRFVSGELEFNWHHRRSRKMGGARYDLAINGLANLLVLCVQGPRALGGSLPGCHSSVQSFPREWGFVVPQGSYTAGQDIPPEVYTPVMLRKRTLVYLDPVSQHYLSAPIAAPPTAA